MHGGGDEAWAAWTMHVVRWSGVIGLRTALGGGTMAGRVLHGCMGCMGGGTG